MDYETEYNLNTLAAADTETQQVTQTWEERIVAENRVYQQLSEDEWQEMTAGVRESIQRWIAVVVRMFAVGNSVDVPGAWVDAVAWDGRSRGESSSTLHNEVKVI